MNLNTYQWIAVAVLALVIIGGIIFFILRGNPGHEENTGTGQTENGTGNTDKPPSSQSSSVNGSGITSPAGATGELQSFSYRPGYSDMDGGYHERELKQNDKGEWIIVDEDREEIGMDTVLVTYAVSDEAVVAFTRFIEDKKILELENRPESEDFWTDYRPWSYTIVYKDPEGKKYSNDRHYISQYRKYSDDDYALIKELSAEFTKLYGEEISRGSRDDDSASSE
ncbi:MAG: hypothetical protein K6E62_05905 [Lachnospiraceae bacterium]|nr:hypothetical protein [Lachnospiraceae bacterium]